MITGPKSPFGLIAKGISCLLDLYNASVISSPDRVTWLAGFVREFDLPFPRALELMFLLLL